MDNLEIVNELRICMKQSSSTLTELQLSLSDSLAMQARKPPPDSEPEDSDVDDEFQVVPASQNTSFDTTGPAKVFRAQEERKIQEAVLGRIFDVEPYLIKKPHMRQKSNETAENDGKKDAEAAPGGSAKDPREEFVTSIKGVSTKLMCLMNGSRDLSISQQDILDTIEKAARKYVTSGDLPATDSQTPPASNNEGIGSSDVGNEDVRVGGSSEAVDSVKETVAQSSQPATVPDPKDLVKPTENLTLAEPYTDPPGEASTSFHSPKPKNADHDIRPEDIDIAQMDGAEDIPDDVVEPQPSSGGNDTVAEDETPQHTATGDPATSQKATASSKATTSSAAVDHAIATIMEQRTYADSVISRIHQHQNQAEILGQKIRELQESGASAAELLPQLKTVEAQLRSFSKNISIIQSKVEACQSEVEAVEGQILRGGAKAGAEATQSRMDDYVRDTRGFSLESLSIHLIPVKASVLSRAIDLRCLKQLTLLNVGNQAPIWTLLAKENKSHPLSLRSVYTDNVSNAFLTCMSQLDELHELFLLERGAKHKPESFAPRSSTTIDQIRRLVLKKHMMTLKRLMIKDESNGPSWDANEKTMILICSRGVRLEELAVSMNIHAVVSDIFNYVC